MLSELLGRFAQDGLKQWNVRLLELTRERGGIAFHERVEGVPREAPTCG